MNAYGRLWSIIIKEEPEFWATILSALQSAQVLSNQEETISDATLVAEIYNQLKHQIRDSFNNRYKISLEIPINSGDVGDYDKYIDIGIYFKNYLIYAGQVNTEFNIDTMRKDFRKLEIQTKQEWDKKSSLNSFFAFYSRDIIEMSPKGQFKNFYDDILSQVGPWANNFCKVFVFTSSLDHLLKLLEIRRDNNRTWYETHLGEKR